MKDIISKSRATIMSTPASRIAAGFSLAVVTIWMLLGNLGCITWDLFSTFVILFNPAFFEVAPGRSGNVDAELQWAEARPLEVKAWKVDSNLPRVLDSATCNPTADSEVTHISLKCGSDPTVFNAETLWTASTNSVYQLGVKASFVDPLWKSLAGQEVVIGRRAYLPMRYGQSQMTVTADGRNDYGDIIFRISVTNPLEGYKYTWSGYYKYADEEQILGGGTLSGGVVGANFAGTELVPNLGGQYNRKMLVVFNLIQNDANSRVIRSDMQSFRYPIKG
jgi:hypothetical protein